MHRKVVGTDHNSASAAHSGSGPLRILVLAPFPPDEHGVHGGAKAIAGLVSALAKHHHVALVHLRGADEAQASERVRESCELLVEVPRDEPKKAGGRLNQKLHYGLGLLVGRPVWVSKWSSSALPRAIRKAIRDWQPDIVQLEFEVMARYLNETVEADAPVVLTVHDPGYASIREPATGRRRSFISYLDGQAWWRFERAVLDQVDAAVAFTSRDATELRMVRARVHVECIPIGHTIPQAPADPAGTGTCSILFVGNFIHPPNRDAASWLVESILPRVRSEVPSSSAVLVGDGGESMSVNTSEVQFTGRVPDLWPFLEEAAVVVAPIRLGGGMRVKLMEALAAGKAVVATPRAAEGLAVTHGRELLLAESDHDFSDAIVRLLNDAELRIKVAGAARQWAAGNLGWNRSARDYERLYRSLLERRSSERMDS